MSRLAGQRGMKYIYFNTFVHTDRKRLRLTTIAQKQTLVASNGYIHYRIKPISTIPVNSIIPNYAAIYFDFNLPVLTNTTTTSIILNNDLQEKGFVINDEILIYPNPATNQITIHSNSNIKGETIVSIKNTLGEILLQRAMELTGDLEINIADLPAGLYFLQLKSKNKNIVKRFVKEY